jgi:hypothetical protein
MTTKPKPVVDAFALASIRSPLAEAQAAVEQAESVVAKLEAKRAACVKRGTELADERAATALEAHGQRQGGEAAWRNPYRAGDAKQRVGELRCSPQGRRRAPCRCTGGQGARSRPRAGLLTRDLLAQSPSKMGGPAQLGAVFGRHSRPGRADPGPDSERFRPTPRTCGRFRSILSLR